MVAPGRRPRPYTPQPWRRLSLSDPSPSPFLLAALEHRADRHPRGLANHRSVQRAVRSARVR